MLKKTEKTRTAFDRDAEAVKNKTAQPKNECGCEAIKNALELERAKAEDYADHLKRLQAEFENYAKRVEKERRELLDRASERIIVKLLIIIDDFERALLQIKLEEKAREGIGMILKNMHKILDEERVVPIEAKGCKFDPYKHEVVCKVESELPEDFIVEDVQKGYMMNGKVIRYSKVTVSKDNKDVNETMKNKDLSDKDLNNMKTAKSSADKNDKNPSGGGK